MGLQSCSRRGTGWSAVKVGLVAAYTATSAPCRHGQQRRTLRWCLLHHVAPSKYTPHPVTTALLVCVMQPGGFPADEMKLAAKAHDSRHTQLTCAAVADGQEDAPLPASCQSKAQHVP